MLHRTTSSPATRVRPSAIACAVAGLALAAACGSNGSSVQCHVGADCASGACGSNGQCVPVSSSSSGGDAGVTPAEAGSEAAAAESGVEGSAGDDGSTGCKPTGSGTITRDEVPMMAGLHASFVIAENVTMSTGGTAQPDGSTDWDFSGALSGDHTDVITTDAPTGQWFSPKFTTASYTSKLSDTSPFPNSPPLLGVYQATQAALLLQGVVTPTSASPQTEVSYSPAAEILAVPLQMGTTWTSTSTVTGTLDGVVASYTEKYDSKVDAHGTLKVPYGTFQVLRVQTTLTQTVGTVVNTTQTMTFVAECFGPVAKLTSKTTTFPQAVPGDAFTDVAGVEALAVKLALAALAAAATVLGGCAPSFYDGVPPGAPKDALYAEVAGARIRFTEMGDGPPVVLIHGFASALETWRGVAAELAKKHRVLALDLKGFGWSSRPDGDYSPQAEAQLVLALMEQRNIHQAAVVAHSWGSSVALAMALAAPERVTRLALYDAWVYEEQLPTTFLWARANVVGEALFDLFYAERPDDKIARAFYDPRKYVTERFVEDVERALDRPGTTAAALAAVRAQRYAEMQKQYAGVKQPVLLLWGREDEVTLLTYGERLARDLPHAHLVVYPRCGHFPMIEAAGPSTEELVKFLDEAAP